jgi:hypothetical protein
MKSILVAVDGSKDAMNARSQSLGRYSKPGALVMTNTSQEGFIDESICT